ncbi:MAG: Rsd/AlgQ family anti-sigma factor [Porticoccaceae bacterium]|jgi:regulator of sigma D|nr:Rsd/AlgQ family anti-sigma factor [Porticoccaceae bacterium]MBT5795848.1 Rsd/AlgQ family anti-sigma factor [Porticoccaceae bacterium]
MVTENQTLQAHWNNTGDIIDRWLEDRRELLAMYCELTEITDFSEAGSNHSEELKLFCEMMVDYASAGHFEIFDYLNQEGTLFKDKSGLKKGNKLIEKIQPSTELILDFNEKYLITDDLESLVIDLASVGETLAKRFDQEDTLIDVLHSSHVGKLLNEPQTDTI